MSDPNLTLYAPFAADRTLVSRIGPTFGIVRTTESRFFNAGGLIETAAAGEAVFEYDPITRISLGLRVEESRENVCLRNRDSTNAVWVKLNMTAVKDQVGEDGVANSASSLLATAGNATAIQAFTIGSTAQTGTFSIKRLIGSGDVDITIDDGVTFTTVNINSLTWTRFDVTQTLADPDIGVRLVTSGDKIAIDFQGLEAGAFPTSRIATVASSVTRNKDDVSTTDMSWLTAGFGTVLSVHTQTDAVRESDGRKYVWRMDDSGFDRLALRASDTAQNNPIALVGDGSANDTFTLAEPAGLTRIAGAWDGDNSIFAQDGTLETQLAGGHAATAHPSLGIGSNPAGGNNINGHIAEIRYYNVRKDNAFLEALSNGSINEDSINLSRNLARPLVRNIARPY